MGRVLLVEDDSQVAKVLCQVLESMGHEVRLAFDGDDGFRKFRDGEYELVITDILMPRKSGMDLIKELIKLDPEVKIIAISGGSPNLSADDCLRTPSFLAERTLQKPFTRRQFEVAVERVLGPPVAEDLSIDSQQRQWPNASSADNTQ